MKRTLLLMAALSVVLLAKASIATAGIPQQMYYQGYLTDESGPLDTTIDMTFTIYDQSTGGAVFWTETQDTVIVISGLFYVVLGSINPIPDTVFADTARWLGIKVGDDSEIYPRTILVSVAYAFRVATVDRASGGVILGDVDIQSDFTVSGNATIGPGHTNTGSFSFVTGENNIVTSAGGAVIGGYNNSVSEGSSVILGGHNNTITDESSAILGSEDCENGAMNSVIMGQYDTLTLTAFSSMAFGNQVYLENAWRVALFEGSYSGRLGVNRDDRDGGISYPIHVGTSTSNGNGAYLTAGGTWTSGSSRTFKENFQSLGQHELLQKISSLPVEAWQYKDSDERHIGPVSEDFVKAFDVGVIREDGTRDDKYLAASDVAGVALAGVKELIKENEELKQILEEMRQRLAELERAQSSGGE